MAGIRGNSGGRSEGKFRYPKWQPNVYYPQDSIVTHTIKIRRPGKSVDSDIYAYYIAIKDVDYTVKIEPHIDINNWIDIAGPAYVGSKWRPNHIYRSGEMVSYEVGATQSGYGIFIRSDNTLGYTGIDEDPVNYPRYWDVADSDSGHRSRGAQLSRLDSEVDLLKKADSDFNAWQKRQDSDISALKKRHDGHDSDIKDIKSELKRHDSEIKDIKKHHDSDVRDINNNINDVKLEIKGNDSDIKYLKQRDISQQIQIDKNSRHIDSDWVIAQISKAPKAGANITIVFDSDGKGKRTGTYTISSTGGGSGGPAITGAITGLRAVVSKSNLSTIDTTKGFSVRLTATTSGFIPSTTIFGPIVANGIPASRVSYSPNVTSSSGASSITATISAGTALPVGNFSFTSPKIEGNQATPIGPTTSNNIAISQATSSISVDITSNQGSRPPNVLTSDLIFTITASAGANIQSVTLQPVSPVVINGVTYSPVVDSSNSNIVRITIPQSATNSTPLPSSFTINASAIGTAISGASAPTKADTSMTVRPAVQWFAAAGALPTSNNVSQLSTALGEFRIGNVNSPSGPFVFTKSTSAATNIYAWIPTSLNGTYRFSTNSSGTGAFFPTAVPNRVSGIYTLYNIGQINAGSINSQDLYIFGI